MSPETREFFAALVDVFLIYAFCFLMAIVIVESSERRHYDNHGPEVCEPKCLKEF